jgi:hypothetical protein
LPPRRRPRPPRRRRRRASSLSSPDFASLLTTSAFTGFSTLALATTGAALGEVGLEQISQPFYLFSFLPCWQFF